MNQHIWAQDDDRNVKDYTDLVARYGVDVKALDWGSRESQFLRFSVLAGVGPLAGGSVLDVGCGMGDLYGWLRGAGVNTKYRGIDLTPKMVEIARERFPDACFEVMNLWEQKNNPVMRSDYIIASGIFYRRRVAPFDFLKQMVTTMFDLCQRAVSFNSLSTWGPEQAEGEFHANPLETVAFCRMLSPRVVLRHDYHPQDFTIHLYKEEPIL